MNDTGMDAQLVQLQQRIDTLMEHAQHNEAIQQRCHQLELALIASHGFEEYLHQLLVTLPSAFALDAVSLHLYDPDYMIRHLMKAEGVAIGSDDALQFHADLAGALSAITDRTVPLLQAYDGTQHEGLFEARQLQLGSIALLPLRRGDILLGMLILGSGDTGRFAPEQATDFLQHLAAIAAVCLENAINHERLNHMGLTDALTGVRNRRYFEQRLLDECSAVQRHGRPLACLFIDLDHFKRINDHHGHHNGDRVLQEIAKRITQQLRDGDMLSRYGGEEFVILLMDTDAGTAKEVAERIRANVAKHEVELPGDIRLSVTLSIGIAVMDGTVAGTAKIVADELVEAADAALYLAKRDGRDRVALSDSTYSAR